MEAHRKTRHGAKTKALCVAMFAVFCTCAASKQAAAEDLSVIVARAREQVENGAYADALRTLNGLPKKDLPQALAVEAALLETTAALVSKGAEAGESACASPENFDAELVRKIARANAVNKVWPLMGYELKSKLAA